MLPCVIFVVNAKVHIPIRECARSTLQFPLGASSKAGVKLEIVILLVTLSDLTYLCGNSQSSFGYFPPSFILDLREVELIFGLLILTE